MKNKKIAWEKFTLEYEDSFVINQSDLEYQNPADYDLVDESDHELKNDMNIESFFISKKIKTPFGTYDIDDPFSPYNMFECWIGYSNFKLTDLDFEILDTQIDGIGCLALLSPYRFIIGIEKMFSFQVVRMQIQKSLCNNLDDSEIITKENSVDHLMEQTFAKINDSLFSIKDAEKWAVFIGNDGTIETIKSSEFNSDKEYNDKLITLQKLKNGNILTYDSL